MSYFTPERRSVSKCPSTGETVNTIESPPCLSNRVLGKSGSSHSLIATNSIGSLWTVEMCSLKYAGSYFEAAQCLRRIREILNDVDRADRLKFCRADYENAVKILRKQKLIWSNELFHEVISITNDFFNISFFPKLPTVLIIEIFHWLPPDNFYSIVAVNKEFHEVGVSNEVWSYFYQQKFLINNPGPRPALSENHMGLYHSRLNDPQVGDKVEVAWRGKFRLETQDVYQGLAWWVAEIVDKHPAQGRYKIRYPGWESRWDEWVPRARLRWAAIRNNIENIQVGDIVELWCCGANVPGAWLESKVKKIRNGRYCIGRVLSSGYLWVERNRLRLVRKSSAEYTEDDGLSGEGGNLGRGNSGLRNRRSFSLRSLSGRITHLVNNSQRTSSCSIM